MSMELVIDADKLQQAILRSPVVLERELDKAIGRSVHEIARSARRLVPKAHSILVNSIHVERPSALEGIVAPSTDYAQAVEEGTGIQGPQGTPSNVMPPIEPIEDWIRVAGITPNDPSMNQNDLAWAIARSIAEGGTPPQPYMAPALEEKRGRAEQLLNVAIDKALQ